jgi:ribosomal protein S18 acetylase RimI-like enzyme
MADLKIEKAKTKDLKEISAIFMKEANKKPYNQKWNKETVMKKVKKLFKEEEIYISKIKNKIVGFASIYTDKINNQLYISELWVTKKFQRKGIGREMLKTIEKLCKKKKLKKVGLCSNIKSEAIKFYDKLNYKEKYTIKYMEKIIN